MLRRLPAEFGLEPRPASRVPIAAARSILRGSTCMSAWNERAMQPYASSDGSNVQISGDEAFSCSRPDRISAAFRASPRGSIPARIATSRAVGWQFGWQLASLPARRRAVLSAGHALLPVQPCRTRGSHRRCHHARRSTATTLGGAISPYRPSRLRSTGRGGFRRFGKSCTSISYGNCASRPGEKRNGRAGARRWTQLEAAAIECEIRAGAPHPWCRAACTTAPARGQDRRRAIGTGDPRAPGQHRASVRRQAAPFPMAAAGPARARSAAAYAPAPRCG
jgi:hypothetical protein